MLLTENVFADCETFKSPDSALTLTCIYYEHNPNIFMSGWCLIHSTSADTCPALDLESLLNSQQQPETVHLVKSAPEIWVEQVVNLSAHV